MMESVELLKNLFEEKEKVKKSLEEINRLIHDFILKYNLEKKGFATEDLIWHAVESVFGFSKEKIIEQSRKRQRVLARNAVIYFFREYTSLTFPEIGEKVQRDHSTVQNSYKVFYQDHSVIEGYANKVEAARKIIIE